MHFFINHKLVNSNMSDEFLRADACQKFFCFRNNVEFVHYGNPSHINIKNARYTLDHLYDTAVREFNNWSELDSCGYEKREVLYYLDLLRLDLLRNEDFVISTDNGIDGVWLQTGNRRWSVRVRYFSYNNIGDSNTNGLVEIFRDGTKIMTHVTPGSYSSGFVFWFLHQENYGLTLCWGKSRLYFRSADEQKEEKSGLFSFLKKWF